MSAKAKKMVQKKSDPEHSQAKPRRKHAQAERVLFRPRLISQKRFLARFGACVRGLRIQKGWTIKELGERASIAENYLGGIELGHRDAGYGVVIRIAKALGTAPRDLLGTPAKPLTKEAETAARLADQVDPEILRMLIKILKLASDEAAQRAEAPPQPSAGRSKTRARKAMR